jgi:hypothetical protein
VWHCWSSPRWVVELCTWARTLSEFRTTGVDREFTGSRRGGGGVGDEQMPIACGLAGDRGMKEESAGATISMAKRMGVVEGRVSLNGRYRECSKDALNNGENLTVL